jgi:guanosine-3',5'-bis(diphosphate) 3'-pyrophosphohydrolase
MCGKGCTFKDEVKQMQFLYQKALNFAAEKHSVQKVPGTVLPYVVHLTNVAMEIFIAAMKTPDFILSLAVQIALLHDTLEDTDTTYDELLNRFGKEVADGVLALTKDHKLPKESQMQDSLERIRKQPHEVWAVKLADRITNLQPPPKHWTKEKRLIYQEEARIIYCELKDGNEYLADRLNIKIKEYCTYI